jgi:methylated-DNA-protein-cysteine methyltransferase related protein
MQSRDAILAAVLAIPQGSIRAYGEVARRAGLPGRARMVARVLAEQPDGSQVPWHRVVRSGGLIAFAPGSADFDRQRVRLEAEGCRVTVSGRVIPKAEPEAQSLDRLLWDPAGVLP